MVQHTHVHVEDHVMDGKQIQLFRPTVHTQQSAELGSEFFGAFEDLMPRIALPHIYIVSDRRTHVDALYRIMLYRRLEGSLAALNESLGRLTRSQKSLLDAIYSTEPSGAIEAW